MRKQRVYVPAVFVLGLMAGAAVAADTSSGVDLSGTWILNQKLSDDPQAIMKQRAGSGGGGGGYGGHHSGGGGEGGEHGGYGGGHGGGGGYGGHGGGNAEQVHQRMSAFAPAQKLVIVETGDKVLMIPDTRDTVTVIPDGKPHERQTPAGTARVEASWTDVALQVKMTTPGGRDVTRLYRINSDGRLEVVTELPVPPNSNEKTMEIVLRYDEAKATTKSP